MPRRFLLALLLALAGGCVHHAVVKSEPAGATVRVGNRDVGVAPVEVRAAWWPWRPIPAHVALPGYRQVDLRLGTGVGPWQAMGETLHLRKPESIEILLVRRHGGAGTWTPEDVP